MTCSRFVFLQPFLLLCWERAVIYQILLCVLRIWVWGLVPCLRSFYTSVRKLWLCHVNRWPSTSQADWADQRCSPALSGSAPAWILSSSLAPNSHLNRNCVDKIVYTPQTVGLCSHCNVYRVLHFVCFSRSLVVFGYWWKLLPTTATMLLHIFKQ